MKPEPRIYGLLAEFDGPEKLVEAAEKVREAGYRGTDAYSPFPIHGIDGIIGVPRTWIAICAFIYGLTGLTLGTWMMWYMMVHDWPTDIGGKPSFAYYMNVPAFVPISFECTVLCAAHGMAITFFLRSWLVPGAKAKNPDPRTTDDKFMVVIETKEENKTNIEAILRNGGAEEVHFC